MMKTFMAFDYGSQWTGLAIGSKFSLQPHLLECIKVKQHKIDEEALKKTVEIWQPDAFVVGVAYYADDRLSSTGKKALAFGRYLQRQFDQPCYYVDERLSSWQAATDMKQQQGGKHLNIHSQSAAVILETFLQNFCKESI